jgi:eukaryotic-like serine/threonine-protein kinase
LPGRVAWRDYRLNTQILNYFQAGDTDIFPELMNQHPIVEKMIMQDSANRFASIDEIKKELIALKQQHISRQKLSELDKIVINKNQIEDPLINDPIKIIGVDWNDGKLIIKLNHNVNSDWIWAFNNMGGYQSLIGKAPENFRFSGSTAYIHSQSHSVQDIINYFKEWLPRANQRYLGKIRQDIDAKEHKERIALQKEKEAEQKRLVSLGVSP